MRSDHLLVAAELATATRKRSRPSSDCARRSACTCGTGSPANSADSSPPVPARISRNTLRSSFGILRQQRRLQVGFERLHPRRRRRALLVGECAHARDRARARRPRRRSASALRVTREQRATTGSMSACSLVSERIAVHVARDVSGARADRVELGETRGELVRAWCEARISSDVGADSAKCAASSGDAANAETDARATGECAPPGAASDDDGS